MATHDEGTVGPFYHGTKADLKPGDLITPGYRSNYGHGMRTSAWVYLSALLPAWAAELAVGDAPGRIYVVEPAGPIDDDPDLTDKRFAGNPTKSYRSRFPLRVVSEVESWQGHAPDEIAAMKQALENRRHEQAARIARIPSASELQQLHAHADAMAHDWAPDAAYRGCTLFMRIRGEDVAVISSMTYASDARGDTRIVHLPRPADVQPPLPEGIVTRSGRITDVTAWQEGWAAVLESCVTEIGLGLETRIWIAVDARQDSLTFRVDSDGPARSWQRSLHLARGVLADAAYGEIWNFAAPFFPPTP